MKIKITLLSFSIFLVVAVIISNLNAFCIHNLSDKSMNVVESAGGKGFRAFKARILKPNEKKCCHWSNKDCNKSGKRDGLVRFIIYRIDSYSYIRGATITDGPLICDVEIPAGGDVYIEGKNNQYICRGQGY